MVYYFRVYNITSITTHNKIFFSCDEDFWDLQLSYKKHSIIDYPTGSHTTLTLGHDVPGTLAFQNPSTSLPLTLKPVLKLFSLLTVLLSLHFLLMIQISI